MIPYQPYKNLDGVPNLIVDGRPHKDSVLVLSHWKGSGTPGSLMRDTSAQIVLDYLSSHPFPKEIVAVSNDHFDQDGLVGIFSVLRRLLYMLTLAIKGLKMSVQIILFPFHKRSQKTQN